MKKTRFIFIVIFFIIIYLNKSFSIVMTDETENIKKDKFVFIYSHGFNSAGIKAKKYIRQQILPRQTLSFNYDDAKKYLQLTDKIGLALGIHKSAIGQSNDVKKLSEQVDDVNCDSIILFGESRGASTIINYLGTNIVKNAKIKGVILDSPFDELINAISYRLKTLHLSNFLKPTFVEKCFSSMSKNYNLNGLQPINSIKNINNDIPILFICSKEDKMVPWFCSLKLYKTLIENEHKKAHIIVLPFGRHACLTDGKCKEQYRNAVHAFLKKYNLPCDNEYALQGEKELLNSQPDLEQIDKFLKNNF